MIVTFSIAVLISSLIFQKDAQFCVSFILLSITGLLLFDILNKRYKQFTEGLKVGLKLLFLSIFFVITAGIIYGCMAIYTTAVETVSATYNFLGIPINVYSVVSFTDATAIYALILSTITLAISFSDLTIQSSKKERTEEPNERDNEYEELKLRIVHLEQEIFSSNYKADKQNNVIETNKKNLGSSPEKKL